MFGTNEMPATHTREIVQRLDKMRSGALQRRARESDKELFNLGITFTVYSDKNAIDRVLPFDVIPRVLSAEDWAHINAGCIQRVTAINQFIEDVYHDQRILKDGVVPHWRGIYDDDDRLMVAINWNMDLGDAWEHADVPEYPEEMTALAYRYAINYIIYSMTH